jgi:hypothetical protein
MAGLNRREERGRFQYRPRTAEDIKEQTEQQGGSFDSIFKSNIDIFKVEDGENAIRFCPPTWQDARSYSYEIWVHYNVGPRGGTYLCLKKMLNKRCPVCDAEADALQHGDKDDADELKAKKRKVAWVIDRNGDSQWPCGWSFGWTLDRDIGALLTDRKRGKVLQIDNPDNGYDVTFQRQSAKDVRNTKYFGFSIDRESSPMLDDERDQDDVLDFLQNNPLPDVLKYYSADYLEELVSGTAGENNDDDDFNNGDYDMVTRAKSTRGSGGSGRGRDADDAPRGRGREETRRGGRRDDPPPEDDRETRRGRGRDEDDAPRGRGRDRDDAPRRDRDRDDDRDTRRGRGRDEDTPADDDDLPFDSGGDDNYDPDDDPENTAADDDRDAPRGRGGRGRDADPDDAPRGRGGRDRDADQDADRPRTARGGGGGRGGRNGDARGAEDDRDERTDRSSRRPPPREQGRRSGNPRPRGR